MDLSTFLAHNWMLIAAVYVCTQIPKMLFPEFAKTKVGQRLLPVFPILVGILGAFAGMAKDVNSWQDKLLLGAVSGFSAGHMFKLGKTSVLGWGASAVAGGPAEPDAPVESEVPAAAPAPATVTVAKAEPATDAPKVEDSDAVS